MCPAQVDVIQQYRKRSARRLLRIPVSAMATKCMDRSGPSQNLTTVEYTTRNQVFLAAFQRNGLSIDDQRIASAVTSNPANGGHLKTGQ